MLCSNKSRQGLLFNNPAPDICKCEGIHADIRFKTNTATSYNPSVLRVLNRAFQACNKNEAENHLGRPNTNRLADLLTVKTSRSLTMDQTLRDAFEDPVDFLDSKVDDNAVRFRSDCCPQTKQALGHYIHRRADGWRFVLLDLDGLRQRLFAPTTPAFWIENEVLKYLIFNINNI